MHFLWSLKSYLGVAWRVIVDPICPSQALQGCCNIIDAPWSVRNYSLLAQSDSFLVADHNSMCLHHTQALQPASLGYFGRGGSAPGELQHTQLRGSTPGPPPRGRRPVARSGRSSRSRARSPQSDTALVSTSAGSQDSPQGSGGKRRGPESEQVAVGKPAQALKEGAVQRSFA